MAEKVDFWFDPVCPWTWITSRWLVEVSELRDLDITWHAFSLWDLNKDKDGIDPQYRASHERQKINSLTAAAVEVTAPEKLGDFYTALSGSFFPVEGEGREKDEAAVLAALESVGLDVALFERAQAGEFDEYLLASTNKALALVGDEVGVPIIQVAGVAFFGPVISPAPHGEDAAKLWDGTLALAQIPGFYELKRSRTNGPIFS